MSDGLTDNRSQNDRVWLTQELIMKIMPQIKENMLHELMHTSITDDLTVKELRSIVQALGSVVYAELYKRTL